MAVDSALDSVGVDVALDVVTLDVVGVDPVGVDPVGVDTSALRLSVRSGVPCERSIMPPPLAIMDMRVILMVFERALVRYAVCCTRLFTGVFEVLPVD